MEVKKAIQHLKCGKAAGPDGILAEMIKTAEHEITLYLTKYFNVLFARAKFPLEWSKAGNYNSTTQKRRCERSR